MCPVHAKRSLFSQSIFCFWWKKKSTEKIFPVYFCLEHSISKSQLFTNSQETMLTHTKPNMKRMDGVERIYGGLMKK